MKKIFTISLMTVLCCSVFLSFAQERKCGTMEYTQWMIQNNPEYAKALRDNEARIQEWINNNPNFRNSAVTDTIPVVVHVVYRVAGQNISDAQVQSQIDVLNEDWGRTNADTVNTPAVWKPVAGSVTHRWKLACVDPNGNPTNGIRRVATTVTSFSTNNAIKHTSTGGDDAWDVTRYFNFWVGNLGGGLLGYAEFPTGTPSNTFGYVNIYNAFGRVGTLVAPYNLGRTCSHEVGHCFNLYHIWGDDGGACTGTDYCADTPNQAAENYGCPTFPHTDACTTTSPGVMFMNYMDYSDDACMNMYTKNQCTRMNSTLAIAPYNALLTSTAGTCNATTGISSVNQMGGIKIYPNPSSGNVQISNLYSDKGITVKVSDMLGNVVKNETISTVVNHEYNMDLSVLPNGVYYIQVLSGNTSSVSRLILQK